MLAMPKSTRIPEVIESPAARSGVPVRVPAAFDDAVAWAAWLYYVDQMNQSDVAKTLNVSRAKVVNLLQEAREIGVVNIQIRMELANRTSLAQKLAKRFGLVEALVIPSRSHANLIARLGDAAARVLADQLRPGDVIGVAWGRTVLAAARSLSLPNRVFPLTVVQVAGSTTASEDFSPELCTSLLSSRLDARCVNLLAPAVLSSVELRDRLMAESMLVRQFEIIRSANRILFGVGELGAASTFLKAGYVSSETVERYTAKGAVGAIIGRFIGDNGRPVPGEFDDRMIGITLEELKQVPNRICVAGGAAKRQAIRATLLGGYASHFVTDVDTASKLLS
jgi:DNA-binding transcriptional regulator LsrR (DeoR family)